MAKIDTSKINGFDTMTPEQKLSAILDLEIDDGSSEIERYKNAASKANGEAAEFKKKLNAHLSEEEKKAAETAELLESLKKKVAEQDRIISVSDNKAKLLGLGYEEKLAEDTAGAMADGNLAKVFDNLKVFLETHDNQLKADLLKNTPTPPAGSANPAVDYAKMANDALSRGDMENAVSFLRKSQESNNS